VLELSTTAIDVPEEVLEDLRARLDRTRLPNAVGGIGWDQGTDLDFLAGVLERWRTGYDWRATERRLNAYEHVLGSVDGQQVHALVARSASPAAVPLLLCHGWPGSVMEFLDVLPLLTDRFHVVVPSLPGFGWSGPTSEVGWNPRRIAGAFVQLMAALGFDRYGCQGGDWGSVVAANVADLVPERVLGLHLNFVAVSAPEGAVLSDEDKASLARMHEWRRTGAAYQDLQGTKPQSLGYGLQDSPAGLAGWILEKFHGWSEDLSRFPVDRLLDNVTAYWVTGTAASSLRIYWEMRQAGAAAVPQRRVTVPTGVANFPAEITRFPRSWVEHRYELVHWTEPPAGGHFAAMEVPDVFAADVQAFFSNLR
jgi:epoxide hydrolase